MVQRLKLIPIGTSHTDYQRSPCLHMGCNEITTEVYQAEVYSAGPTMSRFLLVTGDVRRMISDPTINQEAVHVNKNGKNTLSAFACETHIDESEGVLETLSKPEEPRYDFKPSSSKD
mgnify:CR=1 FL=1